MIANKSLKKLWKNRFAFLITLEVLVEADSERR